MKNKRGFLRIKNKLIFVSVLFLVIIATSSITSAKTFAQEQTNTYYADINIAVDNSGNALISGISNHPLLTAGMTSNLTSKKGNHWLLNISPKGTFSDAYYKIQFPKDTIINYIKAPQIARIEYSDEGLAVISTAKNQPISVIIQYRIEPELLKSINPILLIVFVILLVALLIAAIIIIRKKINFVHKQKFDFGILHGRQKEIMKLIIKLGGQTTQKALENILTIPKSSLSRNIDSLSRKGFIEKHASGMTNVIKFKNPEEKKGL